MDYRMDRKRLEVSARHQSEGLGSYQDDILEINPKKRWKSVDWVIVAQDGD
jgi:hypothetical protein